MSYFIPYAAPLRLIRSGVLIGALILIVASQGQSSQFGAPPPPPPPIKPGTPAPKFASKTLTGQPFSTSSLRGHVAVLDFWATWCISCKTQMPALDQIQREYAGKNVRVVGVSLDSADTVRLVNQSVKKLGVRYTIVADPKRNILAGYAYNADVLPCIYVIDRKGFVRWSYSGTYKSEDKVIRKLLDKLITEK